MCWFEVTTGNDGTIVLWDILLREEPFGPGKPQATLDVVKTEAGSTDQAAILPAEIHVCAQLSCPQGNHCPGASTQVTGRWRLVKIFEDSFETGDTSAWTPP